MRAALIAVALTTAGWSGPAQADVAADIRALEAAWGQAFLAGDYKTVARIVAPEFKLMTAEDGKAEFAPREKWLANASRLEFHEYEVNVINVLVSGNTAVATVEGRWKISRADRGTRDSRFLLSDTWVKRNGRWQALFRHAQ